MRTALSGLRRQIVTAETSKHKPFVLLPAPTIPDHKLYVIASDDAWILGVLSSHVHGTWALAAGGRLGVGNDPTWTNTTCFLPFPFPNCSDEQCARIRAVGESLDAHRKRQQTQHPDLTITGMYNVLEKLRSGEKLTAKEQKIHEQGLVSVLKQIHDELDAAVLDAYGWPHDLTDEQILERLVALNAERAAEERRGLVRWLRPEFENPAGTTGATQGELAGTAPEAAAAAAPPKAPKWPARLPEQIAVVRNLVVHGEASWSVEEAAREFKGARRDAVAAVLDGLAALGLLLAYEVDGVRRWKAPSRTAA